ncbi:MAG: hypothetical protein LBG59_03755 [Candidatus Peribacteria bacterium]|nr:hypothetical protein [Candidatus Peribacteria bacterium]
MPFQEIKKTPYSWCSHTTIAILAIKSQLGIHDYDVVCPSNETLLKSCGYFSIALSM